MNTLERILGDVVKHNAEHPEHNVTCACHLKNVDRVVAYLRKKKRASRKDCLTLFTIFARAGAKLK